MQRLRISKFTISFLSLLMVALLLAQTLGEMHRVAHAKQIEGRALPTEVTSSHNVNALWGDHANASDCRVFDQSSPDLLTFTQLPLSLPSAVPVWIAVVLPAWLVLFERFYAAQGPPVELK